MRRHAILALVVLGLAFSGCGGPETEITSTGVSGGERLPVEALADLSLSHGQLVYVPVYSHLAYKEGDPSFAFAANVSIRNADRTEPILISSAKYYDSDGKLLREYLEEPRVLGPLATTTIFVRQSDMSGGLGANFLIAWQAQGTVVEPVIEAIMVGRHEVRMATFRSPGRVIEEIAEDEPAPGD